MVRDIVRAPFATWRRKTFRQPAPPCEQPYLFTWRGEDDMVVIEEPAPRPVRPALWRGWRGRCPNCGGGGLFSAYLKVRDRCVACDEELFHHRADDMPTWLTIIIVGHIVALLTVTVHQVFGPPLWVHWSIFPALALFLALFLLPRMKGAVVGLQWANRMHGFGGEDEEAG